MILKDKNIVISQISKLHSILRDSSLKEKKEFSTNENGRESSIGIKVYVKKESYIEELGKFKESNKNYLLLSDNSIISFIYHFNKNGEIIKHSLYYLPDVEEEFIYLERTKKKNPEAYSDYFNNQISKYIRIDFDSEGQKDYYHSLVHMHNGLIENDFRFPLYSYLYPNEFVYLVLKYIYNDNDESIKSISEFKKNNRKVKLTNNEQEKFFASIGIFHE